MWNIESSSNTIILLLQVYSELSEVYLIVIQIILSRSMFQIENDFFGKIDRIDFYCFVSTDLQIQAQIRTPANRGMIKQMRLLIRAMMQAVNVGLFFFLVEDRKMILNIPFQNDLSVGESFYVRWNGQS